MDSTEATKDKTPINEGTRIRELNSHSPLSKCKHLGWDWEKHGRRCFNCGTFVVDFGD